MRVGDLVNVNTKHYGEKLGVVTKIDEVGVWIKPQKHPRNILARPQDVTWYGKVKSAINNMQLV